MQVLLIRNTLNEEFVRFVEIENAYAKEKPVRLKTEVQLILLELLVQFENDLTQNIVRESEEYDRMMKASTIYSVRFVQRLTMPLSTVTNAPVARSVFIRKIFRR